MAQQLPPCGACCTVAPSISCTATRPQSVSKATVQGKSSRAAASPGTRALVGSSRLASISCTLLGQSAASCVVASGAASASADATPPRLLQLPACWEDLACTHSVASVEPGRCPPRPRCLVPRLRPVCVAPGSSPMVPRRWSAHACSGSARTLATSAPEDAFAGSSADMAEPRAGRRTRAKASATIQARRGAGARSPALPGPVTLRCDGRGCLAHNPPRCRSAPGRPTPAPATALAALLRQRSAFRPSHALLARRSQETREVRTADPDCLRRRARYAPPTQIVSRDARGTHRRRRLSPETRVVRTADPDCLRRRRTSGLCFPAWPLRGLAGAAAARPLAPTLWALSHCRHLAVSSPRSPAAAACAAAPLCMRALRRPAGTCCRRRPSACVPARRLPPRPALPGHASVHSSALHQQSRFPCIFASPPRCRQRSPCSPHDASQGPAGTGLGGPASAAPLAASRPHAHAQHQQLRQVQKLGGIARDNATRVAHLVLGAQQHRHAAPAHRGTQRSVAQRAASVPGATSVWEDRDRWRGACNRGAPTSGRQPCRCRRRRQRSICFWPRHGQHVRRGAHCRWRSAGRPRCLRWYHVLVVPERRALASALATGCPGLSRASLWLRRLLGGCA